jgi:uncharacterized protein (DUF362 family)
MAPADAKQAHVHLARLDSYDDEVGLKRIVNLALDLDPRVADVLANCEKPLVVVKPNWVQEAHEYEPDNWLPVITHPNLILCVLEALAQRVPGSATLSICDAPITSASFAGIVARGDFATRFQALKARFPKVEFEILDLRREVWTRREQVVVSRTRNPDDPRGYVVFDLGKDSLFYGHPGEGRYYGADYDERVVNEHHRGETQEYMLAGTPTACDLFINLPKMKTHKKCGITCCLKNLVGINGDKNWLPHHTEGSPATDGDDFPKMDLKSSVEFYAKRWGRHFALGVPIVGTWVFRKVRKSGERVLGGSDQVIRNGNWKGNNTCWRMALDLNRALLYGNMDGTFRAATEAKAYLAIVDGIIAGEKAGPLCPERVDAHVMLCGTNPAVVDAVTAKAMGFEPTAIPIVSHAFESHRWPIASCEMDDIIVHDERAGQVVSLSEVAPSVAGGFEPHFAWKGIEDDASRRLAS